MSRSVSAERIPLVVNKGVTGALFGFAMATYAIRNYIRIRVLKQFSAEDYLLLLAAVCLSAATALAYVTMPYQYDALQVIFDGDLGSISKVLSNIPQIAKEEDLASSLWWFVVFPVKLAYLVFFRRLIIRQPIFNMWWWFSISFTVLGWITCVVADWVPCPYFTTERILSSCTGSQAAYKSIRSTSITTAMDILTDILVISFPLALLWKVQIKTRQKFSVGLILCLSIVMIIIAAVRIGGIKGGHGEVDIVWLAFWQQQECSIALTMVCVTAFRSLLVARTRKKCPKEKHHYSPVYWRQRLMRHRVSGEINDEEMDGGLPQIPRATLTGMTSMIREARVSTL